MPMLGSTPLESDSRRQALRIIGSGFYAAASGLATLAAVLLWLLQAPPLAPSPVALTAALIVFALLCAWAWRHGERLAREDALVVAALAGLALLGWLAVVQQDALRHAVLALGAVLICVVSAAIGLRAAWGLTAIALIGAAALAGLEPPAPRASTAIPLPVALPLQWLVLLAALGAGRLLAAALDHEQRAAEARESRYRGLLDIAADGLWEMDEHFRFSAVPNWPGLATLPAEDRVGRTPWQIGDNGLSEWQLDAHRADLEAHRRFTGLLIRRRDRRGATRIHSTSGAPKFDAAGIFRGYWGVTRDVTDEVLAQRAVITSETRYRELFERSPSPLLLHRRGVVFDANPAAAQLFGYRDSAAMTGCIVAELYPAGEYRDHAAQRLAEIEAMAVGEALPVVDHQARALDGRAIHVQATAVRVDTASGPATLSILFDITARQAVAAALRRSEAMLSHLFATSPDCITLSELASGRHAMVNAAFSRVTGFAAEEVIGRSAAELGLWHDPQAGARLTEQVARDGNVANLPLQLRSRSGARVSMIVSAARFVMDGRDYMVVNGRDVTQAERTRLEHAAILERASIGIAFTRDGRVVLANPRFEQMFGWPLGTLPGEPAAAVWIDDATGTLPPRGEPFEGELQMRRRDGSVFWCRLLAQRVDRSHASHGGTIWIADDVTERRRLDQALAAARDAAEAASRAKSAFLANTSHEIRTPLNGLLGLVRLVMQPDLDPARRQDYLRQLSDSAQGLAGILSDILDLSKIEAGKVMLEHVAFDLSETLLALQHSYQSLADDKGLELALELDPALPPVVNGDPVRVRQILSNFVSNAIKFTPSGSIRIEAICESEADVRLQVVDSGVGIDAATQQRLFEPFSQADTSTTRRHGGTGLGLSICRELARLMGGEVGVRSRAGHGSTFWARLPLRGAGPAMAQPSSEAADLEQLRDARVLLVEDNHVNMLIAAATLEQWGVQVAQAPDGPSAIAAVEAACRSGAPFDAVLMDVQMPEMSGHETTAELRKRHRAVALPIIALTAAALVSERERALAAGMNDFLTKPIDAPLLRRTLARHIAARHAQPADPGADPNDR